jgi:hypothetical protein
MAKTTQAPVAASATNVPAVVVPDDIDFMQDAQVDRGVTMDDAALPFLTVLQDLSPQTKKREAEYVDGAEAGMFFNTVTQHLWDGEAGLVIVPVYFRQSYTLWHPRNKGGGFAGEVPREDAEALLNEATRNETNGKDTLKNGLELVRSGQHFCFVINPENGDYSEVLLNLSATQLKKSKRWNALQIALKVDVPNQPGKKFNPAPFYMSYKATTAPESNDKGSWYGVNFAYDKPILEIPNGAEIYRAARAFRELILSGKVKVAPPPQAEERTNGGGGGGGGGGAPAGDDLDDDGMPF